MRLRYVIVDLGNEVYRVEGVRIEVKELPSDGWMPASAGRPMFIAALEQAQSVCCLPVDATDWTGRIRASGPGKVEVEAWKE